MRLEDSVQDFFRIDEKKKKGLTKLGIKTIYDLLNHFPFRYEKVSGFQNLSEAREMRKGDLITVRGKILKIAAIKTRKRAGLVEAKIVAEDGTALKALWFNQPYIAKMLEEGEEVSLTGKISKNKKGEEYFSNPIFDKIMTSQVIIFRDATSGNLEVAPQASKNNDFASLMPVYSETRGVSSKWFRLAAERVLKNLPAHEFKEFIPQRILKECHLPDLRKALFYIHIPKKKAHFEAARKRFAFQEIFLIQLNRMRERILRKLTPCFKISVDYKELKEFLSELPFALTGAQKKAIFRIAEDFKKQEPMARLLHGDVGSGKTIVALAACFIIIQNGCQAAYMAPTEILARQIFEIFTRYFRRYGVKIGLLTSSICEKFPSKVHPDKSVHISKARLLKWVREGDIKILIGTHSLIQGKVIFKDAAFAVIDEQHRFGVNQRLKMAKRPRTFSNEKESGENDARTPHLLSMSATPIPRTLALTVYGDLDLTLLDETPSGRRGIETYIAPPNERHRVYEHIREEVKKGRQAYVVCPRVNPVELNEDKIFQVEMKAVKEEYDKLSREIFPEFKVAFLHGKVLPKEKEKTMADFKEGKTNILVSTSVIEVGIDVPNANLMLIEGADRFGLAQLHQLRGRIARSGHTAHCFVVSENNSLKTLKRLSALKKAKNGFELAEYDLKFRGAGELSGKKQWGISDIGMEALQNIKMVEAARLSAQKLLAEDIDLKKYSLLKEKMEGLNNVLHWE